MYSAVHGSVLIWHMIWGSQIGQSLSTPSAPSSQQPAASSQQPAASSQQDQDRQVAPATATGLGLGPRPWPLAHGPLALRRLLAGRWYDAQCFAGGGGGGRACCSCGCAWLCIVYALGDIPRPTDTGPTRGGT
jgi:hypothetical protein